MIRQNPHRRFLHFWHDDRAQALPIIALMMTMLLSMTALAVDGGRAIYSSRELQATSDAAALAAAHAIATATSAAQITGPTGVAATYSAASGGYNQRSTLPSVTVTSTLKCLTTLQNQGTACVGDLPYNAVQVTEASVLPMYFAGILGHRTLTISTTSTASKNGGSPRPSNIAVILDTTLSMNVTDSNCGTTAMQCALNGFQLLMQSLSPCSSYQTTCPSNGNSPFDEVSLFTFDNVSVGTAGLFTNCTGPMPGPSYGSNYYNIAPYGNFDLQTSPPATPYAQLPTGLAYSFPTPGAAYSPTGSTNPTYQVTGFLVDYKTSDAATSLNPNSALVKAAGGVSGCGSMAPSNFEADYGTYYAGVLYAAQSALAAQKQLNGADSVLIILSDGDSNALQSGNTVVNQAYGGAPPNSTNMSAPAPTGSGSYMTATSNGSYPSWVGECGQAVDAATYATSNGTLVFSVAYGSQPSGCSTDANAGSHPNITPCNTMASMASAPQYFFSDNQKNGQVTTCTASQPYTSLNSIFKAIAADLSQSRLIPNNMT